MASHVDDTISSTPVGYAMIPEPRQTATHVQRWSAVLVALVPTILSLGLYLVTLTPEVDWGDSAELSLQAYQLGVTHPPGYPVHTFLGRLFILFSNDPGVATNVLSAVFTSAASGLLALVAYQLWHDWLAAVPAALVFALSPQVWHVAVITEIYGLSAFFVALDLLLLLWWYRQPSPARLLSAGMALGISLGSSLANILLLPAFLVLIWWRSGSSSHRLASSDSAAGTAQQLASRTVRRSLTAAVLFVSAALLVGGLMLSWSYFRSRVIPPLGTTSVPDSLPGFLAYLTGAEYTRDGAHSLDFYVHRLAEHAHTFGRSFLWVGMAPGLAGAWSLWRRQRIVGSMLLLVFAANMGYFTGYAATDYHLMVTTSYFVFSLWLANGVHLLTEPAPRVSARPMALLRVLLAICGVALLVTTVAADWLALGRPGFGTAQRLALIGGAVLVGAALALCLSPIEQWFRTHLFRLCVALIVLALAAALARVQWPYRRAEARSGDVTVFVISSFEVLPDNAVVVAQWDKLPPMLFYQKTRGWRADLIIVEPISDWHRYLQSGSRPVLIDYVDKSLTHEYRFEPVPHGWYRILPSRSSAEDSYTTVAGIGRHR
jgi:hypothetical protein